MRRLTMPETIRLCAINELARGARYFSLANVSFLRLLIEAVAYHNEWKIFWIIDKNSPNFDLIGLLPENITFGVMRPNVVLPVPLLHPEIAESLFYACESEETLVDRKKRAKLVQVDLSDQIRTHFWNLFFQIVSPEEAMALVRHNFVRPNASEIVEDIEQYAPKLFAVRADWFNGLPMYFSIKSVLAQSGNDAITKIMNHNTFSFVPPDAIWTAVKI